jgi:flagellar motor switch protein FliM
MSDPVPSILKRMAGAGRQPPDHGVVSPYGAMRLALSRAAQDVVRAPLVGGHVTDLRITLRTMGDMLPVDGLWVLLQGRGRARGLICADASLLAALVQALTTGRISGAEVAERRPTQTDALLVRRVLTCVLETLALRLGGHPAEDWARGYQPRDRVTDPARLPHLLQDVVYRGLSMEVDIGDGLRAGQLLLILPQTENASEAALSDSARRESEGRAAARALLAAPTEMEAVLCRLRMPLAEIGALQPGALLTIPRRALNEVTLQGLDGTPLARARLGQSRGFRAVRLLEGASDPPRAGAADAPGEGAAAAAESAARAPQPTPVPVPVTRVAGAGGAG